MRHLLPSPNFARGTRKGRLTTIASNQAALFAFVCVSRQELEPCTLYYRDSRIVIQSVFSVKIAILGDWERPLRSRGTLQEMTGVPGRRKSRVTAGFGPKSEGWGFMQRPCRAR